ncbi:hypothetical protein TYRP_000370 [Tyrophagus putrescentiae]|nr:hypothetical protein TYRP_000370 [Tyrophagus putrescentiae]
MRPPLSEQRISSRPQAQARRFRFFVLSVECCAAFICIVYALIIILDASNQQSIDCKLKDYLIDVLLFRACSRHTYGQ